MKKLPVLAVFAAFVLPGVAPAQQSAGLSSMGEDFYFTELAPSFRCDLSGPAHFYALISSVYDNCRVTIDYFDSRGSELTGKTYFLSAKSSVEYPLDPSLMNPKDDANGNPVNPNGEDLIYASCHIHSSDPISVSYYSEGANSGALTLVLPTSALGKNYVIACLPTNPGIGATTPNGCIVDSASSEFAIDAVRDSTTVTITPNGLTRGGHIGVNSGSGANGTKHPFQTTLRRGEVYWVKSTVDDPENDMSGSTVSASWPVAVFAGQEDAFLGQSYTYGYGSDQRNMIMQEMVPTEYWRDSDYFSIPFIDPQDASPNVGDEYKFFTTDSRGTTLNCMVGDATSYPGATPFQIPPANEENVLDATNTSSTDGAPIMVEQYDYSEQGISAPSTSPTMMNVVPLENFSTRFSFMVPKNSSYDGYQYLNIIFRKDQYGNIKIWQNGIEDSLRSWVPPNATYIIPGHSELEGLRFKISSGSYFLTGDSAFMVYQYGMYANNGYYSEYAAPTGETFGIDGAGMPTVSVDTLCDSWNITARDTAVLDGGIAEIELLDDPNGIFMRRSGTDSGYVSYNVRSIPTTFTVNPGDTATSFEIEVDDPSHDATAWVLITNVGGNSQLLRLFYTAPTISFLSTQQPPSNSAKFFNLQLGADSCTQLVVKNLAVPGGKSLNVTGYQFTKEDAAFSVSSVSPSLPFALASGDSVVFNVCFDPSDTNTHLDSLLVETDCLDSEVAVTGQAQVGIIWAEDYDFGSVPLGDTVCHEIYIRNLGSKPFIVTSQSLLGNSTDFSIEDTLPISIQPQRRIDLNICFSPHLAGSVSALLQWVTNIPEPFTHDIKDTTLLFGYGTEPLSVSMESEPSDELRIIPSGDQLDILLPVEFENGASISIFDALGRELRAFESKSQTESLDVADLPSGTYYLRASKGNIVKSAVFIVEH